MMKNFLRLAVAFLCVTVYSQEKEGEIAIPIPNAQSFVTNHQGTFGNTIINYTATASETYLKDDDGNPVASIWSVAYTKTKDKSSSSTNRPVTFVFNGGPGSASVWLHMGLFGPQLVKVDSDAKEDDDSRGGCSLTRTFTYTYSSA